MVAFRNFRPDTYVKSIFFLLFLESPFNNIHEAFKLHPKFKIWKCLPGPLADWFFTKRLTDETAGFVSDQIIDQVSVPILFLHAKVNTSAK